jgi:hypothetical protein
MSAEPDRVAEEAGRALERCRCEIEGDADDYLFNWKGLRSTVHTSAPVQSSAKESGFNGQPLGVEAFFIGRGQ